VRVDVRVERQIFDGTSRRQKTKLGHGQGRISGGGDPGPSQNGGLRIIRYLFLRPNLKHATTKVIVFNTDQNHNIRIEISPVHC